MEEGNTLFGGEGEITPINLITLIVLINQINQRTLRPSLSLKGFDSPSISMGGLMS
jgi:hypothetical protein